MNLALGFAGSLRYVASVLGWNHGSRLFACYCRYRPTFGSIRNWELFEIRSLEAAHQAGGCIT